MVIVDKLQTYGTLILLFLVGPLGASLRISEFLASNNGSFLDGDGNASDWIEISNLSDESIDLAGYHLTDDSENLQRYRIPEGVVLPAQSALVIFASSQGDPNYRDAGGFLHSNFSLSAEGEFLALVSPEGEILQQFAPQFPRQFPDISFGERQAAEPDGLQQGYFTTPSPGVINLDAPLLDYVRDLAFSEKRGYHPAPFNLEITTSTAAATIIYTVDGTPPSAENGITYTSPVSISKTTSFRAIAIKENHLPTKIETQTYLFTNDIIRQTRPSGYPTTWAGAPADYDMDPQVVDDPSYANDFEAAFAALPSLSLVFHPDAFFHPTTGIYQNPQRDGIAWERPVSAELIPNDPSEAGFQIDAGVRMQGGSSRSPDTPKHALSLRFRSTYGPGKLEYPLFQSAPFGGSAVEKFDTLQLRPEYNFGWMHRHWYQARYALYGRDQWASDLFQGMGQNGSHGRWVHLFLNGIYWGLYDLHERPDANYMANTFGGSSDDYDTINSSVATNGDLVAFNTMMNLAYGSIESNTTYQAIQEYLDLDAFIDYMLLNAYVGNRDWDGHNWRAARKRETGAPFLFFPWDTEFAASHVAGGAFPNPPNFFTTTLSTNVLGKNGNRRPTGLQKRLARNAEYRLRYADRVRLHLFENGPLTPATASAIWNKRAPSVGEAIVAESARWGDFRRDVASGQWASSQFALYTRDDHYLPTKEWFTNTYLPQRTNVVLSQLRNEGLYPTLNAPEFSHFGGRIPPGTEITITAPSTIYYTTDGSDPRLVGGAINPTAQALSSGSTLSLTQSLTLRARTRNAQGTWSALTTADFTVGVEQLVLSEIMYHPAIIGRAEFLELHNTSSFPISLAGLHFSEGITFDFDQDSSITSVPPEGRLLIVRDLSAFQQVYGSTFDHLIAGSFQNETALSNSGETLTLSDADGLAVWTVPFDDNAPWPISPDGQGPSLIFMGGDSSSAKNWRPSSVIHGNPGTTDRTPFVGGSLLDYALAAAPELLFSQGQAQLTFLRHLTSDDAEIIVEFSTDLQTWSALTNQVISQTITPNGLNQTTLNLPSTSAGFTRAKVVRRP